MPASREEAGGGGQYAMQAASGAFGASFFRTALR